MIHFFKEPHKIFILEALKITLFCLATLVIFILMGVTQSVLLVLFNIAVMSCAAIFSPEKKRLTYVLEGGIVMLVSIILGGILGFYLPVAAKFLTIIYATLAFLIPKAKEQTSIFVTSAFMFLIFTYLPFDLHNGIQLVFYGLILLPLLLVFYWLFDRKIYADKFHKNPTPSDARQVSALIAFLALSGAWLVTSILSHYTALTHLYWIGFTALVVIQSSQQKTIKISLTRIAVNVFGALIIIAMSYIVPQDFEINFILLTIFLFCIFAFGYSYIVRTLFIEIFVLWITHLMGTYQHIIALDRIVLTLLGGLLVIAATFITYRLLPLTKGKV